MTKIMLLRQVTFHALLKLNLFPYYFTFGIIAPIKFSSYKYSIAFTNFMHI